MCYRYLSIALKTLESEGLNIEDAVCPNVIYVTYHNIK